MKSGESEMNVTDREWSSRLVKMIEYKHSNVLLLYMYCMVHLPLTQRYGRPTGTCTRVAKFLLI